MVTARGKGEEAGQREEWERTARVYGEEARRLTDSDLGSVHRSRLCEDSVSLRWIELHELQDSSPR